MTQVDTPSLTGLPAELIDQILGYLNPYQLARASRVCKLLHDHSCRETFWQSFVQENLPTTLRHPGPCESYRKLYAAHNSHWFLPRYKIFYADAWPHGKLLVARYDPERGSIEAYTLVAERGLPHTGIANLGEDVVYHTFHPKVQLDLNQPVLCLQPNDLNKISENKGNRTQQEVPMNVNKGTSEGISTSFCLTTSLPSNLIDSQTSLWPPLTLPSLNEQRTRNLSASAFNASSHRPSNIKDASDATFRIRQWIKYTHLFPMPFSTIGRAAERVTTYATLPPEAYTPTKEKPWQGIWCGDYSPHGCEFLLVTQPDEPKPLPDRARRAFARWPKSNVNIVGNMLHVDNDSSDDNSSGSSSPSSTPEDSEVRPTNLTRALSFLNGMHSTSLRRLAPCGPKPEPEPISHDQAPYKGRLEAIKLTGDSNVPRGEISFVVDDLGAKGHTGHATDPLFRDTNVNTLDHFSDPMSVHQTTEVPRMVKSVGHIMDTRMDTYIPSQLIMISENRLAQYWMPWGHVCFYERVDIDRFLTT